MNANPSLAERIRAGDRVVGLLVKMPDLALVELAGWLGFDFLIIDTEHGNSSSSELEHHLRASRIPVLVRASGVGPEIPRALDAGAEGVIVPHVSGREDAERAVAGAHYPPWGDRGLAVSTRAGRQGTRSVAHHLEHAAQHTLVIGQIEDPEGVRHAGTIAATPHLDAVWIGPTDLSLSMGIPGELDHPLLLEAVASICSAVVDSRSAALAVIVQGPDDAARWVARGATVLIYLAQSVIGGALRGVLDETRLRVRE